MLLMDIAHGLLVRRASNAFVKARRRHDVRHRYGQEGAPQVGFQHWMHPPEAIDRPLNSRVLPACAGRSTLTLRRQ